jgi:hypothetical protein
LEVLTPLVFPQGSRRTENLYITRGSGFHGGRVGEREESIAQQLGATQSENGARSAWEWWISWRGKVLYATHHIAPAQVYALTPLQREMREAKERSLSGYPMWDVDIRSHVHRCSVVEDNANRMIVTAPAWQLATAFAHSKMPTKLPDVGGLILWLDENDNRLHLEKILYPLPRPAIAQVVTVSPSTSSLTPSTTKKKAGRRVAKH